MFLYDVMDLRKWDGTRLRTMHYYISLLTHQLLPIAFVSLNGSVTYHGISYNFVWET